MKYSIQISKPRAARIGIRACVLDILEVSITAALEFADLKAEAGRKHAGKGLKLVAKDGKKVRPRRIEALPGEIR